MPRADLVDVAPPAPRPAPESSISAPRDIELQRLVVRASDYVAGYSKFRRFQVTTNERVKSPE